MPPDPITDLLNRRIDRLESRLEDRLEERHADLRERIDALHQEIATLTGALLARLDAHEDYHRRNEHQWGVVRLIARHPFRFAMLVAVGVATLSTMPELRATLIRWIVSGNWLGA